MIYYLAAQVKIKNGPNGEYPILSQIRIKRYNSQVAPSIVIADYNASVRTDGTNPIIVGRCMIASDQEKSILEKSLALNELTYDKLLTYKRYFIDGFVMQSAVMDGDSIKNFITNDIVAAPVNMLWRLRYDD